LITLLFTFIFAIRRHAERCYATLAAVCRFADAYVDVTPLRYLADSIRHADVDAAMLMAAFDATPLMPLLSPVFLSATALRGATLLPLDAAPIAAMPCRHYYASYAIMMSAASAPPRYDDIVADACATFTLLCHGWLAIDTRLSCRHIRFDTLPRHTLCYADATCCCCFAPSLRRRAADFAVC